MYGKVRIVAWYGPSIVVLLTRDKYMKLKNKLGKLGLATKHDGAESFIKYSVTLPTTYLCWKET